MLQGDLGEPRAKLAMPGDQQAQDPIRAQRRLKVVRLAEDRSDAGRHFLR
jgi:hypothetical protein